MRTVCGYHANCADGFGAAWAVRNAVRCDGYEPCNYGMSLPDSFIGADVVLVDFSYKRPDMILLSESCTSVLVLDHHASAERELKNLPSNIECVFDMDRSGARIAWDYFNEGDPPSLLLHIEDRDLWRFALPYTREIQSALFSHAYDFSVWDELMSRDARELISDGIAIERKAQKDLRELLAATTRRMLIAGIDVPVANLPYTMASEAGNIMADGEPFAATYFDTPTCRQWSLRSSPDGMDVSIIAAKYGGGGHVHAAGFRLPHGVAP